MNNIDVSNTPTIPNMKIQLQEAAIRYEISILQQELNDSKDLEERVQIWASLVIYCSRLSSLSRSAPRAEEIISPRRLRALIQKISVRSCEP